MQEKYGSKGLSILGVTGEGVAETEKWVRSKGAQYAYAYDKGGKLSRYFNPPGIPYAVLVDASGTIVWKGFPARLAEGTLAQALKGALPIPLFEWSPAAAGARAAFARRNYAEALAEARKLGEGGGGPEIEQAIQGAVSVSLENMKAAHELGNFLAARNQAKDLARSLAGLPEEATAARMLDDIAASKEALEVIQGQEKVAKIRSGKLSKRKDVQAALESLQKLAREYSGTYAGTEANELIRELSERQR